MAAPSTPTRPARSLHRLTTPKHTDQTKPPTSPPARLVKARPNRKSVASVRRKPVPLSIADEIDQLDQLEQASTRTASTRAEPLSAQNPFDEPPPSVPQSPFTPRSEPSPPRYILPEDLPVTSHDSSPPSYTHPNASFTHVNPAYHIDTASSVCAPEDLPTYAVNAETESKTLARSLWRWGFLLPFLWFIGMCIMWIPLRPVEEETDPEKAQKLEELIVILRKTELKYARRCAYAFCIFVAAVALIAVIVAVAVAKSRG